MPHGTAFFLLATVLAYPLATLVHYTATRIVRAFRRARLWKGPQ